MQSGFARRAASRPPTTLFRYVRLECLLRLTHGFADDSDEAAVADDGNEACDGAGVFLIQAREILARETSGRSTRPCSKPGSAGSWMKRGRANTLSGISMAPIAEELKKMLVLMDCGTPRIFEDNKLQYVFRTASHAAMDNVALVRYLKSRNVKIENFNLSTRTTPGARTRRRTSRCRWRSSTRPPSPARTSCRSSAPASTAPRSRR